MNRHLVPALLIFLSYTAISHASAIGPALACVNTSYSRVEDGQLTSDLTKIIAGEFPEHSEAFYLHQIDLHTATLEKNPGAVEARTDLAAALLKLKRYETAEKELLRIESEQPNRYMTHANLGVLYKKTGAYAKAAEHTRKALEIKPEGHLGLGDYYLRMLKWRASVAAREEGAAEKNFLGNPYADGPSATARNPLVDKEHLLTLIKADRHFPHTYLILGDVLFEEEDLQNAARAYLRTIALSYESNGFAGSLALERLSLVSARWREFARSNSDHVFDWAYEGQIQSEFEAAAEWLTEFQRVETVMLAKETEALDFSTVQAEMVAQNYPKPIYEEAGYFKGSIEHDNKKRIFSAISSSIVFGGIGIIVVLLTIIVVRAVMQRRGVPAQA